jgi:mannose-6-phosphate isomerase-like protein (cupin superfamily)
VNHRVIGKETVGAHRLEVLLGTISRGHGALPHAHPNLEQASYLLSGTGIGEMAGQRQTFEAGQWSFNPAGVFHRFEVVSDEPVQVMVIYAPPYSENPNAAVVAAGVDDPRLHSDTGVRDVAAKAEPIDLPHYRGVQVQPIITPQTVDARFLEIYAIELEADGGTASHRLSTTEQVLYIRTGAIEGLIEGQPFSARAHEWVFVPEGAEFHFKASGVPGELFLIRAREALA